VPKSRARVNPKASSYDRIWAVVRRIPAGRVATYGQVARSAGLGGAARLVGYALHALPENEEEVPWQRVLNAQGRISQRGFPGAEQVQRRLLEREGVSFDKKGRVDLQRYGWKKG
jgi:methylated-DNA-protein-cysteine methyltransferase related protein